MSRKFKSTELRTHYKPFSYPQFYDKFLEHENVHWLPREGVSYHEDQIDWSTKLTKEEKEFITSIFRFFTQGDIDVAGGYVNYYLPKFKLPEIRMMLLSFAAREGIHIDAYSFLIETLGFEDTMYTEFLNFKEMREKHDYLLSFENEDTPLSTMKHIAVFSAFTEGLHLFSSFAMLLNFARFGKMKAMSQIVTWSIRDEELHVSGMGELFKVYVKENKQFWTDENKKELYEIARKMVELEDNFIDMVYANFEPEGLPKEDLKRYIRYICDVRLRGIGLKANYGIRKNPLPWIEWLVGKTHTNFFEQKSTDYAKGALIGSWGDVWAS